MAKIAVKVKGQAQAGINKSESVWWRILWSTPLLVVFAVAVLFMGPQHFPTVSPVEVAVTRGRLEDAGGVPLKINYTGLQGLDSFVGMYVASFTPGMAGLDESEFLALIPRVLDLYSIVPGSLQWIVRSVSQIINASLQVGLIFQRTQNMAVSMHRKDS
jgi:hypothetical protein